MNTLQRFDYSQYIEDGKVNLENLELKDCMISEIAEEMFYASECTFDNVIFDNHSLGGYIWFESCRFCNCHFHDTCGDGVNAVEFELTVTESTFEDCYFENIKFLECTGQSELSDSTFANCIFKNITIIADIGFTGLEIEKGIIEHFHFVGGQILGVELTDVAMEQVNMEAAFLQCKMTQVIFKEVTLKGWHKDNKYIDCDETGLTILENDY